MIKLFRFYSPTLGYLQVWRESTGDLSFKFSHLPGIAATVAEPQVAVVMKVFHPMFPDIEVEPLNEEREPHP